MAVAELSPCYKTQLTAPRHSSFSIHFCNRSKRTVRLVPGFKRAASIRCAVATDLIQAPVAVAAAPALDHKDNNPDSCGNFFLTYDLKSTEAELLAEKQCVSHLTGEDVGFCVVTEDTMLPGEM